MKETYLRLLVTPISELTDSDVELFVTNRDEIKSLIGTPEHASALKVRADEDYAKALAQRKHLKELRKLRAYRMADDAAYRAYCKTFYPKMP